MQAGMFQFSFCILLCIVQSATETIASCFTSKSFKRGRCSSQHLTQAFKMIQAINRKYLFLLFLWCGELTRSLIEKICLPHKQGIYNTDENAPHIAEKQRFGNQSWRMFLMSGTSFFECASTS